MQCLTKSNALLIVSMINLTDSAIKQITKLSNESAQKISICAYLLRQEVVLVLNTECPLIAKKRAITKLRRGIVVLIDPSSLSYLNGCTIHFDDGLTGKDLKSKILMLPVLVVVDAHLTSLFQLP